MDIFDLKQSVTSMAIDEVIDGINEIRRNRRNITRAVPVRKATIKKPEAMQLDYNNMDAEVLAQLLDALGGSK